MIKIYIVDDHQLIREGMKKIIKEEVDMQVIGDTGNPLEVQDFIIKNPLDIVMMDISMPDKTGLDLLKEIKIINPEIPVLILSMHPEDRFALRALKAGASGYITKESATDELVKAIRKIVIDGGKYFSSTFTESLAFELPYATGKPLHENLTDREFQVMHMIASGKNIKEISNTLGLTVSTVHSYRTRVLKKMNLKSDISLTHYAIQHRLVD